MTLGNLGDVRRRPYASLPNLQLDVKDAGAELTRFSRAAAAAASVASNVGNGSGGGGGSSSSSSSSSSVAVVETTPRAWRAPEDFSALAQLATDCPNVRLIFGTGCVAAMVQGTAPSELAALFVRDLKQGFAASQTEGSADTFAAAAAPQGYEAPSISPPLALRWLTCCLVNAIGALA